MSTSDASITTFTQAGAAFERLSALRSEQQELSVELEAFFGRVAGSVNQFSSFCEEKPPTIPTSNGRIFPPTPVDAAQVPDTLAERVVKIISDSKTALMPKDVVASYQRRGWPLPPGKLYTSITASIGYLTKRKKVLTKTTDGYEITPRFLVQGNQL